MMRRNRLLCDGLRQASRKGQMEMVGLVFVVPVIVIGIIMYVTFSGTTDNTGTARQVQAYTSFITAFGETELPACGLPAARVAQECFEYPIGSSICGGEPCDALQEAMDAILASTLERQGIGYNMSLEGTGVMSASGFQCRSTYTAKLPAGRTALLLQVCR